MAMVVTGIRKLPENAAVSVTKKWKGMKIAEKEHCEATLKLLMDHPAASHFAVPLNKVKPKLSDDCLKMIRWPMDLGEVKRRLEEGFYLDSDEFAWDVRLTFGNAMRVSGTGMRLNVYARKMREFFGELWAVPGLRKLEKKEQNKTTPVLSLSCSTQMSPKRLELVSELTKKHGGLISKSMQQLEIETEFGVFSKTNLKAQIAAARARLDGVKHSKVNLEAEREAARAKLDAMKQTVLFDEGKALYDLRLCQKWHKKGKESSRLFQLEAFGLRLKPEY